MIQRDREHTIESHTEVSNHFTGGYEEANVVLRKPVSQALAHHERSIAVVLQDGDLQLGRHGRFQVI